MLAVRHFYELLAQKELQRAYAMLAAFEQARTPYDSWAAGYANTVAIEASATPGLAVPNRVRVSVTATEHSPDGSQQVQRLTAPGSSFGASRRAAGRWPIPRSSLRSDTVLAVLEWAWGAHWAIGSHVPPSTSAVSTRSSSSSHPLSYAPPTRLLPRWYPWSTNTGYVSVAVTPRPPEAPSRPICAA
jgi:hypothetical protein